MKSKNSAALRAAFVYAGVILGAGFASGAEIAVYFVDFKWAGLLGLALSCLLLSVTGYAIWRTAALEKLDGYRAFMEETMGSGLSLAIEVMLGIFMFIVFSAMLSATGAAINQSFGLSVSSGVYMAATFCFIASLFDMSGIINLNAYVTPVIILGCVIVGTISFFGEASPAFVSFEQAVSTIRGNWLMASLVYTGYNITTAVAVLSSMGVEMRKSGGAFYAAILSGVILFALGLSVFLPVYANYPLVRDVSIPMLTLASRGGVILEYGFMGVFLMACFTTAATNGYAVVETISARVNINKTLLKLVISSLGVLAAYIGFSGFVKNIYPIFAIGGLLEMFFILKYFLWKRLTKRRKTR